MYEISFVADPSVCVCMSSLVESTRTSEACHTVSGPPGLSIATVHSPPHHLREGSGAGFRVSRVSVKGIYVEALYVRLMVVYRSLHLIWPLLDLNEDHTGIKMAS